MSAPAAGATSRKGSTLLSSELDFELAVDAERARLWMLMCQNIAMLRRLVAEALELMETTRPTLRRRAVGEARAEQDADTP